MGKTWDTEKIEKFIESFAGAYDRYTDDLHSLEDGMSKYYFNDTYRGQAAEASKNFIGEGQSKLHMKQIDIQRRLVLKYYEMLDSFKDKVDSSPVARIDTDLLMDIKKRFMICDNVIDVEGYNVECKTRYIADKFGHINGNLIPSSYRMVGEMYEDFCGSGGLFDYCVRKVEEFDAEMCSDVDNSGIEDDVDTLQDKVVATASALDTIHVYAENVQKNSVGLVNLSASISNGFSYLNQGITSKNVQPKYFNFSLDDMMKDDPYYFDLLCMDEFLKKYGIKVNKIKTNDGYFILDKSLAEIFEEAGVDSDILDYTGYDDWYITGLTRDNGSICYSMIKVREPMDEQGRAGTSIVFDSMSISPFKEIIANTAEGKEIDDKLIYKLNQEIDLTVHSDSKLPYRWDQDMINYFRNTESEGSYLIADFIVDKVAHDEAFSDGTYKLPYTYDQFDDYAGQDTLDYLAEVGVYDKENNTITINDPDNLTDDERNALILITTGDKDAYAFAGENQFHADAYNRIPYFENHAKKSDAGVGEGEAAEGITIYEILYKKTASPYYISQYIAHKGEG